MHVDSNNEDKHPVIIDNGSGMIKAGFAGQDAPHTHIPCTVGRPLPQGIYSSQVKDSYIGGNLQQFRGVLSLSCPIQQGVVTSWDDMENFWYYTYHNELRVAPEDQAVLLTDSPLNPKENREKMAHIMFEGFKVPAFYASIQAVLALYASGRLVGTVVDSGDGATHAVPIYEGYAIDHAIESIDIGGHALTMHLSKFLREKGLTFSPNSYAHMSTVKDIKEKLCFVSPDYDRDLANINGTQDMSKDYELPDGSLISVDSERFRCTEPLFRPSLLGSKAAGIDEATFNSILKCDVDIRRKLFKNVVLAGGSSMFKGLSDRMQTDLTSIVPSSLKVDIIAHPERKYSVWIGGSILAELSTFQDMWISRKLYEEHGPSIIHRKCV